LHIGDGYYLGKMTEKISLPDAGLYTISHIAIGRGGTENEFSKTLQVTTSDPLKGNLIKGGTFANSADHAQWKTLSLSTNGDAKWILIPEV
jgi:hypothetical protein